MSLFPIEMIHPCNLKYKRLFTLSFVPFHICRSQMGTKSSGNRGWVLIGHQNQRRPSGSPSIQIHPSTQKDKITCLSQNNKNLNTNFTPLLPKRKYLMISGHSPLRDVCCSSSFVIILSRTKYKVD